MAEKRQKGGGRRVRLVHENAEAGAGGPQKTDPAGPDPKPRPVSKTEYQKISGRQVKILNEQAGRYGIPCGGPVVDLAAVVRWIHDFLAKHQHTLRRARSGQGFDAWRARHERIKAKRAALALGRERGLLMDRTEHEAAVDAVCRQFANLLSRLPEELATEVAGRTISEIRKILRGWSERTGDRVFGKPE